MAAAQARAGVFLAIVGPSGAGKDSLIAHARRVFAGNPQIHFVRRVVTRQADPTAEDHDTLSVGQFVQAEADGRFAVTWQAHGLHYGIPAEVLGHLEQGGMAIANCSRGALAEIFRRIEGVRVVNVTARPEIIAARLAQRGREAAADIERRFARRIDDFAGSDAAITIDNSGALAEACAAFDAVIAALLRG